MGKFVDITGQRFGRLVAISRHPEPHISPNGAKTSLWICKCDCGNECVVRLSSLTTKTRPTQSCGCYQADRTRETRAQDLTGRRFGHLEVVRAVDIDNPQSNGRRLGWLCRCDCGNEKVYIQKELVHNGIVNCGCLSRAAASDRFTNQNVLRRYDGTTITKIVPKQKLNNNNKSGYRGVFWSTRGKRWIAEIKIQGKRIRLGHFKNLEDAVAARAAGEEAYFAPVLARYAAEQKEKEKEAETETEE